MTNIFSFFILNKYYIILLSIITILLILLLMHSIALNSTQVALFDSDKILGLILHLYGNEIFKITGDGMDYVELVRGNEDRFCDAIDGFWNEENRKCHNVSYESCRQITGTMIEDTCILK